MSAAGSLHDRIGIFARTFAGSNLDEVLHLVWLCGIRQIQLNLSSAGLPTLPAQLSEEACAEIARSARKRKLEVAALSGTFNMIDPDRVKRLENLRRLEVLAASCRFLDTRIITLCTGTRDPENMWRRHPDNDTPEAWADLVAMMREVALIADRHEVTMAFEPEHANVVDSARKARHLLDEIGSPWLKVVFDAANLIDVKDFAGQHAIIDEAFELLGGDIALIHAKELAADGSMGEVTPGRGVVDFAHVFRHDQRLNLDVPIIMHGLSESGVTEGELHLFDQWARAREAARWAQEPGIFRVTLNGATFRYFDIGDGIPLVFQHGLTGNATLMRDLMTPKPGFRFISFDARFHGETKPIGDPSKLNFRQSADDLRELLDHLNVESAVIGGLSMGAGIALNFALRYPDQTLSLILSRPAWLDRPLPDNVRMFPEMASLIRALGPSEAKDAFSRTLTYADTLAQSTDSAATLLGMFDDPLCETTVDRLERIPGDCPSTDRTAWRSIRVPTLVLANHQDPIHPYALGEELAREIPGADLRMLTPKCVSIPSHEKDFNEHIIKFLNRHFPTVRAARTSPFEATLMLKCSTSLWSADLTNLGADMVRVEPHSERFHIDVADGHYVPTMLFFPDLVKGLRPKTKVPFEVHLMTLDPLSWVNPFADAGANGMIFCLDSSKEPTIVLNAIRRRGMYAGVSLLISEGLDLLASLWDHIDVLTIVGTEMGIKGATMDESVLPKIREARRIIDERGLKTEIEVDGGIRRDVVPLMPGGCRLDRAGLLMFGEEPAEMRKWLATLG